MTNREEIRAKLLNIRTPEQAREAYQSAAKPVKHYYLRRWFDLSMAEVNRSRTAAEAETSFRKSPVEVASRYRTEFDSAMRSKMKTFKKKKK